MGNIHKEPSQHNYKSQIDKNNEQTSKIQAMLQNYRAATEKGYHSQRYGKRPSTKEYVHDKSYEISQKVDEVSKNVTENN